MKKILFFILLIVSIQSFAQPSGYQKRIVNERIQGSFMVDSAFNIPRYYDTTAANLHIRSDSCGALFFAYGKDSVYFRACNPKRWITVGSGSGNSRFGKSGEDVRFGQDRTPSGIGSYGLMIDSLANFWVGFKTSSSKTLTFFDYETSKTRFLIDNTKAALYSPNQATNFRVYDDTAFLSLQSTVSKLLITNLAAGATTDSVMVWNASSNRVGYKSISSIRGGWNSVLAVDGHSPTITDEVNINMATGNAFLVNNSEGFYLNSRTNDWLLGGKSGGNNGVWISGDDAANRLRLYSGITSTHNSDIIINADSTSFKPGGGKINIDSLRSITDTTANKPMTWNPTTGQVSYNTSWPSGGGGSLGVLDTLLPRLDQWDAVQDAGGTTYKSHRQIVYNVKDYGATGDGVTDDQPAIQRAIDSCHSQGGGVVYFPNGIYLLTATVASGRHLQIPLSSYYNTDSAVTVELRGETPPVPWTNPLTDAGSALTPLTGVILKSSLLSNTAIIGAVPGSSPYGGFNFTYTVVKNLGLRVRSMTGITHVAPQGSGIDGSSIAYLNVDNVRVDTESPRDSTIEPASTAIGISYCHVNNWVQNSLTNSLVTGFYKAVTIGEHFKSWNVQLDGNYYGLVTYSETQHHVIAIDQIGIWRTKYNIQVNGTAYINITNLQLEDKTSGSEWFVNVSDLDETTPGTSYGFIGYHRVVSGSGIDNTFTRTTPTSSKISTYPSVNGQIYSTGYGKGYLENLTPGSTSTFEFKAVGNAASTSIGTASSTSTPYGAITPNNAFLYTGSGDIALMADVGGGKVKIATGGSVQTHAIDPNGWYYGGGGVGSSRLGYDSNFGGLWFDASASSPSYTNATLVSFGDQKNFNAPGASGNLLFTLNGTYTNTMLYKGNKLGIGFAYTDTPDSTLHVIGGLKFVTGRQGAGKVLTSDANGGADWNSKLLVGSSRISLLDSVYLTDAIPYSASAGVVHLGIDTVVGSPTFGKLVRKTASGSTSGIDDVLAIGQALTTNRTVTQGTNDLTFDYNSTYGLRISSGLQFIGYGAGGIAGTPTFGLAVDASGNVVEVSLSPSPIMMASYNEKDNEMIKALIKAIKTQQGQIDELKKEVGELKRQKN